MAFDFRNLDEETRQYMVDEIERAIREGNIYFSKRFNAAGTQQWPGLLLEAARSHDEHWLAYKLEANTLMKGMESRRRPLGGYTVAHVPETAAQTMAEGQFNRYYILGVCRRAEASGQPQVTIYRAKQVAEPRADSQRILGQSRDPATLIAQLRPVSDSLGQELIQPNSGLSVYL
jgi:hypothetical protein